MRGLEGLSSNLGTSAKDSGGLEGLSVNQGERIGMQGLNPSVEDLGSRAGRTQPNLCKESKAKEGLKVQWNP